MNWHSVVLSQSAANYAPIRSLNFWNTQVSNNEDGEFGVLFVLNAHSDVEDVAMDTKENLSGLWRGQRPKPTFLKLPLN
jgi:hypothetical protein